MKIPHLKGAWDVFLWYCHILRYLRNFLRRLIVSAGRGSLHYDTPLAK